MDTKVTELRDIPYTLSFVVRKRMQIDNLNEIPKDKKPPEDLIWDGAAEEIENWIEKVFKNKQDKNVNLMIKDSEYEG